MGVINVTPDSFSDGGQFLDPDAAVAHGLALLRDGADVLDIGGEATSPRAQPVSAEDELRRVIPVVERLAAAGATVSIDTTKATVARAAVAAGARYINDVSGGLFDPAMAATASELGVTYIAGHLRGRSLAEVFAAERSVSWQEVADELAARLDALSPAARARAWGDPGIGFGKGADGVGNSLLLRHAGDIARRVGRPIMVGPSRKRFVRLPLGEAATLTEVDRASTEAAMVAVRAGVNMVRTHNVALLMTALTAYNKL